LWPQSSILSSKDSSLRVRVTEFGTYGIFKTDSSVLNYSLWDDLRISQILKGRPHI
jgi:hypothetical protein